MVKYKPLNKTSNLEHEGGTCIKYAKILERVGGMYLKTSNLKLLCVFEIKTHENLEHVGSFQMATPHRS